MLIYYLLKFSSCLSDVLQEFQSLIAINRREAGTVINLVKKGCEARERNDAKTQLNKNNFSWQYIFQINARVISNQQIQEFILKENNIFFSILDISVS